MNHVTRFEEMLDEKLLSIPEGERLQFLRKQLGNWELRRDNFVRDLEENPLAPAAPAFAEYTMACCAIALRLSKEQQRLREVVR